MTIFKRAAALLLCVAIASCGGGGGSPGVNPNAGGSGGTGGTGGTGTDGGGTGTPTDANIASFIYQLSKPALTNSGSDASLLTVTALDSNNNPVQGANVSVAVDSGIYTPVKSTTDATGQASGNISIGGSKANRNITATIAVGGQSTKAVVAVTGSQLALTPLPATPAPGAKVRVDMKVTDANGQGVPFVDVELKGSLGFTSKVSTDASGNATAELGAAPATPGTYMIEATALGVQATRSVQVIAAGGAGIPDVTDAISAASLSIVPNTIAPNASGSTTSRAALKAKFLNASNQAVQNVRVRFEIRPPGLGSGEQVSTGTTTVYSDVNGEAIGDYIAGTRSSPTDGVIIRACYASTDADLANGGCPFHVDKTLTVASQPLSITLGDNNLLEKGNQNLTYIKKFDIAVADSAGNPVVGAVVSASVDLVNYGKGAVTDKDATPIGFARAWCANEDQNRNGSIDAGDDINGNGQLDPRKADIILSFVGSNVTGSNGRMVLQIEYAQNYALWLNYVVKVTTNVAGSEGTASKFYVTDFVEGDQKNGSFLVSPYGVNPSCTSPN